MELMLFGLTKNGMEHGVNCGISSLLKETKDKGKWRYGEWKSKKSIISNF